jgi:protein-disulfide isomerase
MTLVAALVGAVVAYGFRRSPNRSETGTPAIAGVRETEELLEGLPHRGRTLGRSAAPATIVVFADLKSPRWQQWCVNNAEQIVDRVVRPAKAALELRLIDRVDRAVGTRDGAALRNAAYDLAGRGRFFDLVSLSAYNQGEQTDSWVTDDWLSRITSQAPGAPLRLDTSPTPAATAAARADDALAQALGVSTEPACFVRDARGRTSIRLSSGTPRSIARAVRRAVRAT